MRIIFASIRSIAQSLTKEVILKTLKTVLGWSSHDNDNEFLKQTKQNKRSFV